MFKRLDNYLLTHRPLLWNTKAITIIAIAFLVHVLFFAAGFSSLDTTRLGEYYNRYFDEGAGVYTMSVLCSAGILITWLVFFLRNNALKEYYQIDRFYMARQCMLILLVMFSSIGFFHSFRLGTETRARSFTSRSQLAFESDILNLSRRFLPNDRTDYLKLNRCTVPDSLHVTFNENINYYDTTLSSYDYKDHERIRNVLKDPDAFTYDNFCESAYAVEGADSHWLERGQRWLDKSQADSVRYVLDELRKVAGRYQVKNRLHTDSLVTWVFGDSIHSVTNTVSYRDPDVYRDSYDGSVVRPFAAGSDFILLDNLETAIGYIDNAYTRPFSADEIEFNCLLLYAALGLSTLLFAYRMFSKRVFLMAIIGTIIWMIIIFGSLVGYGSSNAVIGMLLLICFGSLLLGAGKLGGKSISGMLLCWHLWLVPYLVVFLVQLVKDHYQSLNHYIPGSMVMYDDPTLREMYPFSYWVTEHQRDIAYLGLVPVIMYILLVFTRLARNWQGSPEE